MQASERDPESTSARLADWLASRLPDASGGVVVGGLTSPETSGFSNETHLFDATWGNEPHRRSERFVLRIAPTVYQVFLEPRFAEQYRVIEALAGQDGLPVPTLYGYEADPALLGAPFFVMGAVAGRTPTDNPPYHVSGWLHDVTPDERARMWWSGVEVLARVHRLDVDALGLGFLDDPARGRTGLDQMLTYYEQMLDWTSASVYDKPPELLATARDWMRAHQPTEPAAPGLVWGDARIGNIMYTPDYQPAAVLDWEMASIGPAEIDFAWFLIVDRHHCEGCGAPRLAGFPSRAETVTRYERLLGRPVADLEYYEAFAAYRLAVIMMRVMVMFVELGLMDAEADAILDNTASRLLAVVMDLPSPAGQAAP